MARIDDMLRRSRWPDLSPEYAAALRGAITFVLERFDAVAIVAAGSIVRGLPDRSSGLDIYVYGGFPTDSPFR